MSDRSSSPPRGAGFAELVAMNNVGSKLRMLAKQAGLDLPDPISPSWPAPGRVSSAASVDQDLRPSACL